MFRNALRALLAVSFLSVPMVSMADSYDICREPLKDSLRTIIERRSDLTEEQSTKAWFCSEKFNSDVKSRGGNINLSIPIKDKLFSIVGGFTSDENKQAREAFCSDTSSELSRNAMDYIYVAFTDGEAFNSFNQCVENVAKTQPADLLQLITVNQGTTIFFTVRFTPPNGVSLADPVVSLVSVTGAKCEGSLSVGAKVNQEGVALSCHRDVKQEVSFAVFTDRGARFDKIAPDRSAEIAGACDVWGVKNIDNWADNGYFSSQTWTADLNCSHGCDDWEVRSGVNWPLSVVVSSARERVTNFVDLFCDKARPDVDGNPCAFKNTVAGPTTSPDMKNASITVRTWSGPVVLIARWNRQVLTTEQQPIKSGSRQLHFGEVFEIEANRDDADTYLQCTIDGNTSSYYPARDKGNRYLELIATKSTPGAIVYTYRVLE